MQDNEPIKTTIYLGLSVSSEYLTVAPEKVKERFVSKILMESDEKIIVNLDKVKEWLLSERVTTFFESKSISYTMIKAESAWIGGEEQAVAITFLTTCQPARHMPSIAAFLCSAFLQDRVLVEQVGHNYFDAYLMDKRTQRYLLNNKKIEDVWRPGRAVMDARKKLLADLNKFKKIPGGHYVYMQIPDSNDKMLLCLTKNMFTLVCGWCGDVGWQKIEAVSWNNGEEIGCPEGFMIYPRHSYDFLLFHIRKIGDEARKFEKETNGQEITAKKARLMAGVGMVINANDYKW